MNNKHILSEAYFGKRPNILKMEELLDENIKIFSQSKGTGLITTGIINGKFIKNLKTIEKLLEDEFGFKSVAIDTTTIIAGINAMTFHAPLSSRFTVKEIKVGNDVKFATNTMSMTIAISDIFFLGKYTGGELTAIVLHEIGHNFFNNNNSASMVIDILTIAQALTTINNPKDLVKAVGIVEFLPRAMHWIVKGSKGTTFLKAYVDSITNYLRLKSIADSTARAINILNSGLFKLYKSAIEHPARFVPSMEISTFMDMQNEKFADNFATAYGYGPEISSAFTKMASGEVVIPVVDHILDVAYLPLHILGSILECHPDAYSRIADQKKYLNEEYNRAKSAKAKAIIKENIKSIDDFEKGYAKNVMKSNLKKGLLGSVIMNGMVALIKGMPIHKLNIMDRKSKKNDGDWRQFESTDKSKYGLF